jgi:hypothetical protein
MRRRFLGYVGEPSVEMERAIGYLLMNKGNRGKGKASTVPYE